MAFSSIPTYNLDAPNWQQFPNHQLLMNTGLSNHSTSLSAPTTPAAALQQVHGSSGSSIKPGSMAERARLANVPMPEMALKCPRCESTNTKFCYFNNYSLTQPRHFCKTCRRYWTRGGAMRNVPVGGGCRRNNKKSSKSNNKAKSTSRSECQSGGIGSTSISTTQTDGVCGSGDTMLGLSGQVSAPPRFMASNLVHQLGDNGFPFGGEINGLNNYGQIIAPVGGPGDLNFHFGGPSDPHYNLGFYPFGGGSLIESPGGASRMGEKMLGSGTLLQLSSVKLEENQELNLSRRFLGMPMPGNGQHLNGSSSGWTDRCTGFSSSSTTCHDTT